MGTRMKCCSGKSGLSGLAAHVQEQADRKAQELAQVKAAYEETKARLRKAEEKVQMIMDRFVGTTPDESSEFHSTSSRDL